MLTDRATLQQLVKHGRRPRAARELVCPACGDTVMLVHGRLECCSMACTWTGEWLAELAVKGAVA